MSKSIEFKDSLIKLNTADDAEHLVYQLEHLKDVETLSISGCSIGVDAMEAIAEKLRACSSLKALILRDIFTGRDKYEIPKALKMLGDALIASHCQIAYLDLSDNALGPDGALALEDYFKQAKSLKTLKLNNNGLGSNGCRRICRSLSYCFFTFIENPLQLNEIHCERNRLEDVGALCLATLIKLMNHIYIIKLKQNGIQSQGIRAIADSLLNHKHLKVIDFNDNILTAEGAIYLSSLILKSPKLKSIDVGDCLISNKGACYLVTSLMRTKSPLEELNLSFNEISFKRGSLILQTLIDRNFPRPFYLNLDGNYFGEENCENMMEIAEEFEIKLKEFEEDNGSDDIVSENDSPVVLENFDPKVIFAPDDSKLSFEKSIKDDSILLTESKVEKVCDESTKNVVESSDEKGIFERIFDQFKNMHL